MSARPVVNGALEGAWKGRMALLRRTGHRANMARGRNFASGADTVQPTPARSVPLSGNIRAVPTRRALLRLMANEA